jgi:hypothetical protein
LLAAILISYGLCNDAYNPTTTSSSITQTHQKLPADLQELSQRISSACSHTGNAADAAQRAELASCLQKHHEQQQQEQQWAVLPSIQVSSADALVNVLNLVAYCQVQPGYLLSIASTTADAADSLVYCCTIHNTQYLTVRQPLQ